MVIQLVEQLPKPASDLQAFSGWVFSSKFYLSVQAKHVKDSNRVTMFTKAALASYKAVRNPFQGISTEQLTGATKLGKIFERMSSSYAGERSNAARILAIQLRKLDMDFDTLKNLHTAFDLGADANVMAEVRVTRSEWRKPRDWFTDLNEAICTPLGIQAGTTAVGNAWANGTCLVGTLPAVLMAGILLAQVADAAMKQAKQEKGHLCDRYFFDIENDFCAGYTKHIIEGLSDNAELSESAKKVKKVGDACKEAFEWGSWDEPVTPVKSNSESATGLLGRSSAEKRKQEFDSSLTAWRRHRVEAITSLF